MSLYGRVARSLAVGGRALAGNIDKKVNEDHVRLAVTGLSRAGKTVFLTSIIQNLLAMGAAVNTLPKLEAMLNRRGRNRLRRVSVVPAEAGAIAMFDLDSKIHDLAAAAPAWPSRTEDLSQVSLEMEVDREGTSARLLGTRRIRLDLLDYPGEWLLDLPLLSQTYAEWSTRTLKRLRSAPRHQLFLRFLNYVQDMDAGDCADESLIHKGHRLYRDALLSSRDRLGLRYLQPSRFVCPGSIGDVPLMWFFPMDVQQSHFRQATIATLLEKRFVAYQDYVRSSFFDAYFAQFNRQVLLVDLLGALSAGRAAFDDTAEAIKDLAAALPYGRATVPRKIANGLTNSVAQLVPGAPSIVATRGGGIKKVAFVATKADHVPSLRRDNLKHLLQCLAERAEASGSHLKIEVSFHVAASILSTTDGVTKVADRPVEVVLGVRLGEDKVRPFTVGDVPVDIPREGFWSEKFLELPAFRPPPINVGAMNGIPHLNLDEVLCSVIGDLL